MPTTARKLARYLPPALGQIGSAGAQFVLSLQLLHSLSPEKFGVFAFLMIALQLGFGISTAVLCAPYPLVLGRSEGPEEQRSINRAFATGNLLYALMGACVMALCGLRFSLETGEYLLLFAFSGAMFLRWVRPRIFLCQRTSPEGRRLRHPLRRGRSCRGRAHSHARRRLPFQRLFPDAHGALAGLLPFGTSYLKLQFRELSAGRYAGSEQSGGNSAAGPWPAF